VSNSHLRLEEAFAGGGTGFVASTTSSLHDSSDAVADLAFGPRFTVNTQGDIAIAGNTLMSCIASDPPCLPARNSALRGTVRLRAPGDENYRTLTTSVIDTASDLYHAFHDVTTIVNERGAGS
jgi:hypothetical protein